MHNRANAFLLLVLTVSAGFFLFPSGHFAAASSPVGFGIQLWNYNSTHTVPGADVSLLNGTSVMASGSTNLTGWVNMTAPNNGTFTVQVKLDNIIIYDTTILLNQTSNQYVKYATHVADHSFVFTDNLLRAVQEVSVAARVNSTLIGASESAVNGSAVIRNMPFHSYNVTTSRELVFVANTTLVVNATTYLRNTIIEVPNYSYALTVMDYKAASPTQSGSVGVYDWEVPNQNVTLTNSLDSKFTFSNLWPGRYWVVVTQSNILILKSLVTLSRDTSQYGNRTETGFSITLHLSDVVGHAIQSVKVDLVSNNVIFASEATDSTGSVTFSDLPQTFYQLNFPFFGRSYSTSANVTGAPIDTSVTIDDVLMIAGSPFGTAPIVASLVLILTVALALGTLILYRRRTVKLAVDESKEPS